MEKTRAELRRQIWRDGKWSCGFVIVVCALALAWVVLFFIQRNLDVRMLEALGYVHAGGAFAQLLGLTIALGVTVIGIVVWGLLGLHSLLPSWVNPSAAVRRIVAVNLLAAVVLACFALATIAPYRAKAVLGPQVMQLQASLSEQLQDGGDPTEITETRLALAAAQERLAAGEGIDRTLATAVPLLELVVSPAPVFAAELLFLLGLSTAIRGRRRREFTLERRINRINDRFSDEMAEIAWTAGVDPAEVGRLLAAPPELAPAGGDAGARQSKGNPRALA